VLRTTIEALEVALGEPEKALPLSPEMYQQHCRRFLQAGTFEIERQFRGQTWRFTLKRTPATLIYSCGEKVSTLTELQAGDLVSVYYQPIGREGVVTLVVIEPKE
jgi:hypothetical protein